MECVQLNAHLGQCQAPPTAAGQAGPYGCYGAVLLKPCMHANDFFPAEAPQEFAEPLSQGIPPAFQTQYFVQPKPGPCVLYTI